MIATIQPPVPPTSAAVAAVNPIVTIQTVLSPTSVTDGSGGASPLANLANGTTVEGFVVNRDAQNNPILRTAIGDLRVTSEVFLKTGSEVTIRVDNSLNSLARIISVDGLTPQDYSAQIQASRAGITQDTISASGLQPLLANSTATPTKAGAAAPNNPVLQAVVLQGQPVASTPSLLATALAAAQSAPVLALAQLSQLRSGTHIRLTVLDLKLPPLPVALGTLPESTKLDSFLPPRSPTMPQTPMPQANTLPLPEEELPTAAAPQRPTPNAQPTAAEALRTVATSPATAVPSNESQRITPQTVTPQTVHPATTAHARIEQPLPSPIQAQATAFAKDTSRPLQQSFVAASAPTNLTHNPVAPSQRPALITNAPNQISASIIGHDADGANILHTPFATLKVYTPQPLPTGTTLLVSADVDTHTPLAAPASIAEEHLASIAPKTDKVIEDVLAWLAATQPEIARELQLRLPNTNHKLASGLLFFIAALKGNELGDLIGKRPLRALEASAPEILSRLRQEIGQIQANIVDSPLTQWTLYPLPIMVGQHMQHLRLYVGKDPNDGTAGDGNAGGHGQRFVLEIELSQLGPMQLDGFVRTKSAKKSFDLMVRSAQPLDTLMTQEIRTIFEQSLAATGVNGQIIFQQGNQHFVRPMADSKPRTDGDSYNTILA